jgi:putative FmdB family regulatory protein
MPLFEYKCESCGKVFEELVSRSDQQVPCPSCRSDNARKLISTFSAAPGGSSGSDTPCGAPSCNSGFS